MDMQKSTRMCQVESQQAAVSKLGKEQMGVYELSDEQLELVRGGDGGDPTGGLLSGLTGKNGPLSMLGGL